MLHFQLEKEAASSAEHLAASRGFLDGLRHVSNYFLFAGASVYVVLGFAIVGSRSGVAELYRASLMALRGAVLQLLSAAYRQARRPTS